MMLSEKKWAKSNEKDLDYGRQKQVIRRNLNQNS